MPHLYPTYCWSESALGEPKEPKHSCRGMTFWRCLVQKRVLSPAAASPINFCRFMEGKPPHIKSTGPLREPSRQKMVGGGCLVNTCNKTTSNRPRLLKDPVQPRGSHRKLGLWISRGSWAFAASRRSPMLSSNLPA